ncbi:hypothetical protein [Paracoccus sp. SSK6]|uniref:hypothetical protein n=1 Tax=Paracoccus sp. SSK6 TaxID=3143131 RepID=UPI00321C0E89
MTSLIDQLRAAADKIAEADDNLLRAIAAIAAHGRIQIIPHQALFGADAKPIICLPHRMYDRLMILFPAEAKDSQ